MFHVHATTAIDHFYLHGKWTKCLLLDRECMDGQHTQPAILRLPLGVWHAGGPFASPGLKYPREALSPKWGERGTQTWNCRLVSNSGEKQSSTVGLQLWTINCQLQLWTINCQLQLWTINCQLQLWTINCQLPPGTISYGRIINQLYKCPLPFPEEILLLFQNSASGEEHLHWGHRRRQPGLSRHVWSFSQPRSGNWCA